MIFLEGCEKSGKSTTADALVEAYGGGRVHHFGLPNPPYEPFDLLFQRGLEDDLKITDDGLIVWDRGWMSDYVYSSLLYRPNRLGRDPWLGEWLYGRAQQTLGIRVVLLGPDYPTIRSKRTGDDQPVDPSQERDLFRWTGHRFNWHVIENAHTPESAAVLTGRLIAIHDIHRSITAPGGPGVTARPPDYVGPPVPRVLVVGQARNVKNGWAPFSSPLTSRYGRALGDMAFRVGWTNVGDVNPDELPQCVAVIACGAAAQNWTRNWAGSRAVLNIPHPAYLYRWASASGDISSVERDLCEFVSQHVPGRGPRLEMSWDTHFRVTSEIGEYGRAS